MKKLLHRHLTGVDTRNTKCRISISSLPVPPVVPARPFPIADFFFPLERFTLETKMKFYASCAISPGFQLLSHRKKNSAADEVTR